MAQVKVAGAEVPCAVQTAQDFDTYTKTVDGIVTKTYGADGPLTYQWSADKGRFKNGITFGQNVTWIAPDDVTEATNVIIRCTIDDPSGPRVNRPDSGSHDDDPTVRMATVRVVPVIDLIVDTADEKTEDTIGGWLIVNHGYEEDNSDLDGDVIEDNQADANAGDRIVASDEDLRDASLNLMGEGKGKWTLTFPDTIKVWKSGSDGKYKQVVSGEASDEVTLPQTVTLKIEGITKSQSDKDVALKAAFKGSDQNSPSGSDKVILTVVDVDITTQDTEPNDESDDNDSLSGALQMGRITNLPGLTAFDERLVPGTSTQQRAPAVARNIFADIPLSVFGSQNYIQVVWQIYPTKSEPQQGMGQIRNPVLPVDTPDAQYGPTVTQIVYRSTPRLVITFKPTKLGTMSLRVRLNSVNGQPITNSATTTAFRIDTLSETDHFSNQVPNNKWVGYDFKDEGHKNLSEEQKDKLKGFLKYTLWVATEPNNGKAEVQLRTTLRPSRFRKYFWAFGSIEKGNINNGGGASIATAKVTGYDGAKNGVYSVKLSVATKTPQEYVQGYSPAFQVRVITQKQYDENLGYLRRSTSVGYRTGFKFASALTNVFTKDILSEDYQPQNYLNKNGQLYADYPFKNPLHAYKNAKIPNTQFPDLGESLAHIAGAHFSGGYPGAVTNIPRYTFLPDSIPGQQVAGTLAINALIEKAVIDVAPLLQSGPAQTAFSLPVAQINWQRGNRQDNDCFFALGGVSLYNGRVNIVTYRDAKGRVKLSSVTLTGSLWDLTDFDYYGAGTTKLRIRNDLSTWAAIVQIGWENKSRDAGQIFYTEVRLNRILNNKPKGHMGSDLASLQRKLDAELKKPK